MVLDLTIVVNTGINASDEFWCCRVLDSFNMVELFFSTTYVSEVSWISVSRVR